MKDQLERIDALEKRIADLEYLNTEDYGRALFNAERIDALEGRTARHAATLQDINNRLARLEAFEHSQEPYLIATRRAGRDSIGE